MKQLGLNKITGIVNYDAGSDQTIIELLSRSHQVPQMRLNIYFQSRTNYGQLLQISIRL